MDWTGHKLQIKNERLQPLYLVFGEEMQLQTETLEAFRQRAFASGMGDWNWNMLYASKELKLPDIVQATAGAGWGESGKIVVLRACEAAPADLWSDLAAWLKTVDTGNTLVLFFRNLDGRLKGIKELKKLAVNIDCETQKGDALIRFVMDQGSLQNIKISAAAAKHLIWFSGTNMSFLRQEVAKLAAFIYPETELSLEHVEQVASAGPGQPEQGLIFRMTEAMVANQCQKAVDYLHTLLDAGEAPLRILPLIERELRLLLAAKHRGSQPWSAVAEAMGESSDYPVKKAAKYCGRFEEEKLIEAFGRVVQADRDMKSGVHAESVLEELVLWICRQN